MALFDSIALAAAEQIRKTAGARAGIVAYRNLLQSSSEETRARGILGGIACALEAQDEHAAFTFAESWIQIRQGTWERDVVRAVVRLEQKRFMRAAHVLAENESRRRPAPFIAYTLARICERRGMPGEALAAYSACAASINVAGAKSVVTAAKLEVARAHARMPETTDEAVTAVRAIDPLTLTPAQKMQHARILLKSPSRFERATALSTLCDLARAEPGLRARAIRHAAAHVDRMGKALTPLEADRARAVLLVWPNEKERALALARLAAMTRAQSVPFGEDARLAEDPEMKDLVRKARAVLAGGFGPALTENVQSTPFSRVTDLALTALGHLRRGTATAAHLAAVTRALDSKNATPRSVLTLALVALAGNDRALHAEGATLAKHALDHAVTSPRGFLLLADALIARERDDLAERALRLAEINGENGARSRLVSILKRRARDAARAGNRAQARGLLIEARRRAQL